MITILFSAQYIILALLVNIILFMTTNAIKDAMTRGKGDAPKQGLPKVAIRNILMILVFSISFVLTWVLVYFGQISLISKSIFLTSSWCGVLATLTYNIGIKEVMGMLKNYFTKMMDGGRSSSRHSSMREKEKHVENEDYYD